MEKIGFIGVGNMGGALAQAVLRTTDAQNVLVSSRTAEKAEAFAANYGGTATDNRTLAETASVIFLGVKPQKMAQVLNDLAPVLAARQERFLLVTMAAGLTAAQIADMAGDPAYPVVRIMPNTPVQVGKGMIPYCGNSAATEADFAALEALLRCAGCVTPLPESLIDAASAVSGCGPAFVCIFIEALADAGVACGLPRKTALDFAAQTLLGTAELLLQTGEHPAALKDAVCSPAGSTIAGVHALEQGGFRAAAENAVLAAFARTKELGK